MSDTSTQNYLPIAGIEEGVVVLKDASLAVVLKILPINFDLKNELEQNAIIAKYQSFLNSLEFPVQILIRSQRLDLEPYLVGLERSTKTLANELLQIHASDYIAFMRSLVSVANIMSKHYYIVLTYQGTASAANTGVLSLFKKQTGPTISRSTFNHYRDELNNRANTVAAGLTALGVRIEALNTQELIELFYSIYNPDISATERLGEMENLQARVVSLKEQEPASAKTGTPTEPTVESVITADAGQESGGDRIDLNPQQSVVDKVAIAEVPDSAQKHAEEGDNNQTTTTPTGPTAPTGGPTPASEPSTTTAQSTETNSQPPTTEPSAVQPPVNNQNQP